MIQKIALTTRPKAPMENPENPPGSRGAFLRVVRPVDGGLEVSLEVTPDMVYFPFAYDVLP